MSEAKTPSNWLSLITNDGLSRASTSATDSGADYAQSGSICTERREAPDNYLPPRTDNGRLDYQPGPDYSNITADQIRWLKEARNA